MSPIIDYKCPFCEFERSDIVSVKDETPGHVKHEHVRNGAKPALCQAPETRPPGPLLAKKKLNYIEFEVSGWLPVSKNKTMGPRGGWIVQKDKQIVAHFANQYKNLNAWQPAMTKKQILVTIVKGPGGKVEDYDNFVHYMKSILDALQTPHSGMFKYGSSLIVDDSRNWVEWDIEQSWGPQRATRVAIWDCP